MTAGQTTSPDASSLCHPSWEEFFLRTQCMVLTEEPVLPDVLPSYLRELYQRSGIRILVDSRLRRYSVRDLIEILHGIPQAAYMNLLVESVPDACQSILQRLKVIQAGGALVYTPHGYFLSILRGDMWDLPKGKREKEENLEACARREAHEETGVQLEGISGTFLGITRHFFRESDHWRIKEVHWFAFEVPTPQRVRPQRSEGIRQVKWFSFAEWRHRRPVTYLSIRKVIAQFFEERETVSSP